MSISKLFQKFKSRNQDLGGGLPSNSTRRLLANGSSLTRGPSLNGILPVPLSSDGGFSDRPSLNGILPVPSSSDGFSVPSSLSDPVEAVKIAMDDLGTLIDAVVNKKSTTSKQFEDVRTHCQSYVPQLGQIFDKFGGAANGQVTSVAGKTNDKEGIDYQELCTILKGVGHLHWMGALFVVLAIVLERWDKASKRSKQLLEHMEKLRRFAKYVLKLRDREQDSGSSGPSESVQVALKVILDHADYCSRGVKDNFLKKFFCANAHDDGLVKLGKDLKNLYLELSLTAQLMREEPSGETFELTDDAATVEDGKRVYEALKTLEGIENASGGVRALVLTGMFGTGKSTVGLKVARQLQEEGNIDKRQCSKILMRGGTDITVTKKQEELYWKLHKSGLKKEFSDFGEGQRELMSLFKDQLQAKPVLLLFDDANRPEDFKELLPNKLKTALHPDSILLVTTTNLRVMSVLRDKGVACRDYEVDVIGKKEAHALLLKKMDVLPDFPVATHLMHSEPFRNLLHLCGGVPLAINAVGLFVRERGQDFLCSSEYSLYDLPFDEAYSKLDTDGKEKFLSQLTKVVKHSCEMLSVGDPITGTESALRPDLDFAFDQLNSNPRIRDVFLDIVAVHLGSKWADVKLACREQDLVELQQLSMIKKVSNGTSGLQEPVVQVHGLLIGLSRKLENTVECRGRRVVAENVVAENADSLPECFWNDQGADVYNRVELLKVDRCKEVLTAGQLSRVTCNIRYLELNGTTIGGKCERVPPRLTYFKCRQSSFPFALSPKLKSLTVLDVEGTWDNDVIQSLPNLQKLKVENSKSLRRLGRGLKNLTIVDILNCPNFESIEGLLTAAVEHLAIVNCPNFRDFSSVTKLKCLKRLSLAGFEWQPPNFPTQEPTEFTEFPEELVIPSGVRILDLSRNTHLKELPRFAPNSRVKKLNGQSCSALKQFGAERIGLTSLEVLHLEGCASLKVLDLRGYKKLHRSEFVADLTLGFIGYRDPEFKLFTDEDDGPRGCAALQRCIGLPFRKTRSLFQKMKSEQRRLSTCCTFPPRSKSKYL